jgi:c(7)-type cytochrome triheme protein
MKHSFLLRTALILSGLMSCVHAADAPNGKAAYDKSCSPCHALGVAGAPKLGDSVAWAPRIKTGVTALFTSATKGKGAMPPRGGNLALTDPEIKAVVSYMIAQAAATKSASPAAPPAAAARPETGPAVAASSAVPATQAAPAASGTNVNTFNRLMRPAAKGNLPPPEDGAHDPVNDGTHSLQPPLTAFGNLSKSNDGNRVDWVKSLNEQSISPRSDRHDPSVAPMVMDLNIVREVKGSMPDVVYPHKQHTQWLDCSNCHPAIFVPQKGANQISMASILLGQKCGVCHGKVAFPVTECRRCHSKSKPMPVSAEVKP